MGNIQRGYFSFERLEFLDANAHIEAENIAHFGDFLFNTRNTLELVGKGATWMGESGKFAFNSNLARFKFQGINTIFFNYLYNTSNLLLQVKARAMGTTSVAAIYPKNLNSLKYNLPAPAEQTKIGEYFQELDNLIGLHQCKQDKLVTLKKAMLQKMFPQPGATTPEIRFEGFAEEWVEKTLKTAADISTGFPFKSSDFNDFGIYLVVTNGNIQNEFSFVDSTVGNRINIAGSADFSQYILREGDILVTMDGSVGRTAKVRDENQILAQRVGRLVAKSDSEFLYQILNTGAFLKLMTTISHGGTIKHISLKEIGEYAFIAPSNMEEQKKIGTYFRKMDELISKHAIQLQKLKQIKSSCLEKMYV